MASKWHLQRSVDSGAGGADMEEEGPGASVEEDEPGMVIPTMGGAAKVSINRTGSTTDVA